MSRLERWIKELGYSEVPGALLDQANSIPTDHPFFSEVVSMFDATAEVNASVVLCLDRVPTVCLIDAQQLSESSNTRGAQIRGFCERLWNQNLARIVLVAEDESIEAWSVDDPKAEKEQIRFGSKGVRDFSINGLLSGEVLKNRATWFDPHKRVDKILLDNVGALVERLSNFVPPARAREITASVIFVAYLEDREIITDAYRAKHDVSTLSGLIGGASSHGLDRLFDRLQKDFNGDFLSPDGRESSIWTNLPPDCFVDLCRFLQRTVLRSGQTDLWRYNFAQIPIELIAGIYETFLGQNVSQEMDEQSSVTTKRKHGAYYTPRLLSDWVVEQALDGRSPLEQKIFDGACGSGMLLTAAFRRVMQAHRSSVGHAGSLDFAARCELLLGHIFGSDIDEDARRLTAFSLYLALLSDLAPRDLELLRRGGHKLPSLKKNIRSGVQGNFFSEKSEVANHQQFSIFLSNPPWREMPPDDPDTAIVQAWADRQKRAVYWPKRQIAAAFALAAANALASNGRIAMILPINLFVSAEPNSRRFRANLITRYRIERITNFADMRRLIFVDADHPFVVVIATRRDVNDTIDISTEEFEYWTPKTDISLSFGRLTLHGADRTVLGTSTLIDETPHLRLRYWGTLQDVALLERLWQHGTVDDLRHSAGWAKGKGFHHVDNDKRIPKKDRTVVPSRWLLRHPYLRVNRIPNDLPIVDKGNFEKFPFEAIAREPDELRRYFKGPRVIWPDGTHPENGVKAIFTDQPFSFQHSAGVLSAPDTEIGRLEAQFLTAYMRSPMGTWLSLLLSASVAAERPKLHVNELLSWPYWSLEKHPDRRKASTVLKKIDRLFARVEEAAPLVRPRSYERLKPEFDELVYEYFGLRDDERVLVEELARYAGPSLQPTSLSYDMIVKSMRRPPTQEDIGRYCHRLVQTLTDWRNATGGRGNLTASAWTAKSVPLGGAVVSISTTQRSSKAKPRFNDDSVISELLSTVAAVAHGGSEQWLTVPDVIVINDDRMTIVKPLVTRFWLERSAIDDATRLATDIGIVRRAKSAA